MEPIEYLRILRRRWLVVVIAAIIGLTAGFVTGSSDPEQRDVPIGTSYRATTTLILDPAGQIDTSRSATSLSIDRAAFFTTVGVVPERVRERLDYAGEGAELAAEITATADSTLGTLQIMTTQSDPERAVELADAFATELLGYLDDQGQEVYDRQVRGELDRVESLEQEIADLENEIAAAPEDDILVERRSALVRELAIAEQRLSSLTTIGPARSGLLVLEEPAPIPTATSTGFQAPESRESRIPLFGGIALALGLGLALILERLDTRMRGREEIEETYGFPVVGELLELPRSSRDHMNGVVSMTQPRSPIAEAYRALRTSLAYVISAQEAAPPRNGSTTQADRPGSQVIVITSAEPGEGKTTTVANLAAAFAEHGQSVLVLDCDFRRPQLHAILNVDGTSAGVSNVLVDRADPASIVELPQTTSVPGVRLITSGTAGHHPSRFLAAIGPIIAEARRLADVVLIDSSPILAVNDVAEIVPAVDLVTVLVRTGRVPREDAARTGEFIRRLRPSRVGLAVIGGADAKRGRRGYDGYGARSASRGWSLGRILGLRRPRPQSLEPASGADHPPEPAEGLRHRATGIDVLQAPAPVHDSEDRPAERRAGSRVSSHER